MSKVLNFVLHLIHIFVNGLIKILSNLKHNTIFIEEFSMVPNKWITKIYEIYTLFKNTIYIFGDTNQCSPVETSAIHYNYENQKQYNKCVQIK